MMNALRDRLATARATLHRWNRGSALRQMLMRGVAWSQRASDAPGGAALVRDVAFALGTILVLVLALPHIHAIEARMLFGNRVIFLVKCTSVVTVAFAGLWATGTLSFFGTKLKHRRWLCALAASSFVALAVVCAMLPFLPHIDRLRVRTLQVLWPAELAFVVLTALYYRKFIHSFRTTTEVPNSIRDVVRVGMPILISDLILASALHLAWAGDDFSHGVEPRTGISLPYVTNAIVAGGLAFILLGVCWVLSFASRLLSLKRIGS